MASHYGRNSHRIMEKMAYDVTKKLAWTLTKKNEHYYDLSYLKGKPLAIIIKLEADWTMCLPQSRQISNLNNGSVMTTHQERHCGSWFIAATMFKSLSVSMISTSHLEDEDRRNRRNDPVRQWTLNKTLKHSLRNTYWTAWTTPHLYKRKLIALWERRPDMFYTRVYKCLHLELWGYAWSLGLNP